MADGPAVAASARGKTLWFLYMAAWLATVAASIFLLWLGADWQVVVILLAPLTLLGIVWKPVFGVCLMAMLVPLSGGLSIQDVFSAEQGMGILFGLGALTNIVLTRKRLHFTSPVVLMLAAFTMLSVLSVIWAKYPELASVRLRTPAQMFVYVLLIISVVQREEDLKWPLRIYVVGCLVALVGARVFGLAVERERLAFAYTGESVVNPNTMGAVLGLGFFTSVYLFKKQSSRAFRLMMVVGMVVMPMGVLLTGGRKAAFFMGVPLLFPFLAPLRAIRRPWLVFGAILSLAALAGIGIFAATYLASEQAAGRMLDPVDAARGYFSRLSFLQEAVEYVSRHPLGAGLDCFRTRFGQQVHNDLFYILANLGFPGALAFLLFAGAMAWSVWGMLPGITKWYASAIVTYYLLLGLGGTWIYEKHYWMFFSFAWLLAHFARRHAVQPQADPSLPTLRTGPAPVRTAAPPLMRPR